MVVTGAVVGEAVVAGAVAVVERTGAWTVVPTGLFARGATGDVHAPTRAAPPSTVAGNNSDRGTRTGELLPPLPSPHVRAAYDTLVALHVVCAVIGFGAVGVSGAYGALGRRGANREEVDRYFSSPGRAEYLILGVPLFGAAAMAVRPAGREFGQVWVLAGFAIWVVASALLLQVVRPAEQRIRQGGGAGSRLMWAAGACDALFVLALLLMVTQPA